MLRFGSPHFQMLWSAFDPLDMATDSVDVLGFQRAYVYLANQLLPGFTTITTTPRYLAMLCAAIYNAESLYPSAGRNAQARKKRLEAVLDFEKAWAVACVLAIEHEGEEAVRGLRGIRSVVKYANAQQRWFSVKDLRLLSNQVRYGGMGAYSTMLEHLELADTTELTIRSKLGERLANSFLKITGGISTADSGRKIDREILADWGRKCGLHYVPKSEQKEIREALKAEALNRPEDHTRWATLQIIRAALDDGFDPESGEPLLLQEIQCRAEARRANYTGIASGVPGRIKVALELVKAFDDFSQAIEYLFTYLRAGATEEGEIKVATLADECLENSILAIDLAKQLLKSIESAQKSQPSLEDGFRNVLSKNNLDSFTRSLANEIKPDQVLHSVLNRHIQVQKSKIEGSEPKASWVNLDVARKTIRLTSQRHELDWSDRTNLKMENIQRHNYRTAAAIRFIQTCDIR